MSKDYTTVTVTNIGEWSDEEEIIHQLDRLRHELGDLKSHITGLAIIILVFLPFLLVFVSDIATALEAK